MRTLFWEGRSGELQQVAAFQRDGCSHRLFGSALKAHKTLLGHLGRILKCGNNPTYLDTLEIITIKCVNLILPLRDQ